MSLPRIASIIILINVVPAKGAFELFPSSSINVGKGLMIMGFDLESGIAGLDSASLVLLNNPTICSAFNNRFGLSDLAMRSAMIAIPHRWANASLLLSRFGNSVYRETTASISIGKLLFGRINVGTALSFYDLTIKDYGSDNTLGMTLSWHYDWNSTLVWGGSLHNINVPKISAYNEPLPQIITTGIIFKPLDIARAQIDREQDTEYSGRMKFGMTYKPLTNIIVVIGRASNPDQLTFGLQLSLKGLAIEYAAASHPNLALSQWFGIGFSFHY